MVKIMILGASGNLANHLAKYYSDKGIKTIGVARNKSVNKKKWEDFIVTDYSEIGLRTIISEIKPDIIINTIAETDLQKCEENIHVAFDSNTLIPQKLINASNIVLKYHVPYIVHISTDNFYSHPGFSDEDNWLCLNNYAATKYVGEIPFYSFKNSIVLRTNFLAFGHFKTSFLDWLITSIKEKLDVNVYTDVLFNPTTPYNIAENILICFKKKLAGVFNLGCKTGWSKAQLFKEISVKLNYVNQNVSYTQCPQNEVKRPLDMRMNTIKAKKNGLQILENRQVIDYILESSNESIYS